MKTVTQLSAAAPHSHVMLLAHQMHSGKVLCACQVPKVSLCMTCQVGGALVDLTGCPSPSGLTIPLCL